MHPAPFTYHRASSVDEAISMLGTLDNAKIISGGHSLIPVMKLRLAEPANLIDVTGIPGLRGVKEDAGALRIGALSTHHDLEQDRLVNTRLPLLAETAASIGDRQVRNRGTIGGALAHADAASDYPASMLATDAVVIVRGAGGSREIPAAEFFLGFLTTALEEGEVITEIRVPVLAPMTGSAYEKLANQASGYAIVGIAAILKLGSDGKIADARVALTGATPSAVRCSRAETILIGAAPIEETFRSAARVAGEGLDLLDDLHASSAYRQRVVVGLTQRALSRALASVS